MSFPEKASDERSLSGTQPASSAVLRRLWESGQRGRAVRQALGNWESLMAQSDDMGWLQGALRSCGLGAEAFAVQAANTRRRGAAREWEALVRSVLQSGDPWWARELLEEAGSGSRQLEALRIEAELAVDGDASSLISAWSHKHRDEPGLEAALEWWMRSGRVEEAERLLAEVEGLTVWRARLAVWRNQPEIARRLLERLAPSPATRCLEAVATVQEGRLQEAESLLRALVHGEARAEARSWLTTVLRKQGRYEEALSAADAAALVSPTFNLPLRLERELAAECERIHSSNTKQGTRLTRLLGSVGLISRDRTVKELEHAWAVYPLGVGPDDPIAGLGVVLDRFGGNHTAYPTLVEQGKLTSYRVPADPGQLGASIQLVQQTRGADAARALYREYARRLDDHPRILLYHGELELWMGAYEEAARLFRDILRRRLDMKWAWIGLGASAMLQGELREAQKIWKKGLSVACAGPTLYVYRGECYRRQGDLAAARRDLELAVRQKPQRLSAGINLALLDGQHDALEEIERKCAGYAALLMEELNGTPAERLEKVLEAMRGNRSSTRVTYHLWGRVFSFGTTGN